MLRRKKRPWHAPDHPAACDEVIAGLLAPDEPPLDLSDMDAFHRKVASGELADMLAQLALLDPELSETRH